MSTLSELIPSGGTQNNIEFVAQGTLANGQTVALRSDGKVEAIADTAQAIGSSVTFESGTPTASIGSTYDSNSNRVVIGYYDGGNSYYGTCVVGVVSGTSISFGTPVLFQSGYADPIVLTFDSSQNKVVIVYRDYPNSQKGTAIVGTVNSGTNSITFGTKVAFSSGSTLDIATTFDSANNKIVTIYRDTSTSNEGKAIVGTVSGTSISFGSIAAIGGTNSTVNFLGITFDSSNNKVACFYQDSNVSLYGRCEIGTVSGTSISFGTAVTFESSNTDPFDPCFDSTNNKVIISYQSTGGFLGVKVGTISGTSVSFGAETLVGTGSGSVTYAGSAYDSNAKKVVVSYRKDVAGAYGQLAVGTVSGTSITFATPITFQTGAIAGAAASPVSVTFDSTNNKVITSYTYTGGSSVGNSVVFSNASTNASSFIGITNAAISSGATGEVSVKGGLSTTADLGTFTPSFSTPVRYTTSNSAAPACSVCYDTTNDRYVMFYTDSTNSNYGYATVGTYSSGTTTWGTPVAVNSVNSSNVKAVFDASQGKVLFVYTNGSDSSKLVSVVGTVSGTSISVGSAVTMSASLTSTGNTSVTYDANVNRSLVLTKVGSDSSKVYASVVSISGTTPTFNGTAVLTGTLATTQNIASCFDPDTNKVAAFVYDANASTTSGYVVTVSASSFSTSAGLNIGIGEALGMLSEYSTVANQVLVFVKPSAVTASQARTFTVAATLSASSDWVNVTSSATASTLAIAEDVSKSVVVLAGQDEISGAQGKVSLATISGASLTVTTATVFQASAANPATAVYNPDSSNVLIGYRNGSTYGTSAIVSVTSDTLTIGSNYFVQDDGSIATTSSTTKAGKAISTTALNLVDPT